jgi:hypothetical protein
VSVVQLFEDLLQPLSAVMSAPTFLNFVAMLTGWLFAQRHTVTASIVAAGRGGRAAHRRVNAAGVLLDFPECHGGGDPQLVWAAVVD